MSNLLAFIDTMILIWWVRQEASPGQADMIRRAKWLMESLEQHNATVLISAVSFAEFLRGSSASQQQQQAAFLQQAVIIKGFDTLAAFVAAELYPRAATMEEYEKRKAVLKADIQIVATAIAAKANVFYSHDAGCRQLATIGGIEAKDLPEIAPTLFQTDMDEDMP